MKVVGSDSGIEVPEFDVLIVLRNGIFWNLECKAAASTVSQKDRDARITNLQRSGSRLASMAALAEEPWFGEIHALYQLLDQRKFQPLPVTLPNQPSTADL